MTNARLYNNLINTIGTYAIEPLDGQWLADELTTLLTNDGLIGVPAGGEPLGAESYPIMETDTVTKMYVGRLVAADLVQPEILDDKQAMHDITGCFDEYEFRCVLGNALFV